MVLWEKLIRCFRKKGHIDQKNPLREFVYLDDISVYSLVASYSDMIRVEETTTSSAVSKIGAGTSFGGGFMENKGELNASLSSTHGQERQVLRKAVIQSQFKDLYDAHHDALCIPSFKHDNQISEICRNDLRNPQEKFIQNGWLISPEKLVRGKLLEVEVRLGTEPIFQLITMIETLLDIFEGELADIGLSLPTAELQVVEKVLSRFLVGLVPIRGQVLDYKVAELEGKQWIAHNDVLKNIPKESVGTISEMFVVGVAEHSLFWKDIRRVLFADGIYKVFARIAVDGVQDTWTPIKLAYVLESIFPDKGKELNLSILDAFQHGSDRAAKNSVWSSEAKERALHGYICCVTKEHGIELTETQLQDVLCSVNFELAKFNSVDDRRRVFRDIDERLTRQFELELCPEITALCRSLATVNVGQSNVSPPTLQDDEVASSKTEGEYYVDAEFIAIYW